MLFYLVCVIPLLWALELDEIARFRSDCDYNKLAQDGAVVSGMAENTTILVTPAPDSRNFVSRCFKILFIYIF